MKRVNIKKLRMIYCVFSEQPLSRETCFKKFMGNDVFSHVLRYVLEECVCDLNQSSWVKTTCDVVILKGVESD